MARYGEFDAARASGDFSALPELHASLAGMKALSTWITSDGAEAARRCCGGHGYSQLSGLPSVFASYVQNVTWEGDNNVMCLQTARFLLKSIYSGRVRKFYFFHFRKGKSASKMSEKSHKKLTLSFLSLSSNLFKNRRRGGRGRTLKAAVSPATSSRLTPEESSSSSSSSSREASSTPPEPPPRTPSRCSGPAPPPSPPPPRTSWRLPALLTRLSSRGRRGTGAPSI